MNKFMPIQAVGPAVASTAAMHSEGPTAVGRIGKGCGWSMCAPCTSATLLASFASASRVKTALKMGIHRQIMDRS